MRPVRRILAAALAVLLFLEAFGPSAWAQVAARAVPASAGPAVSAVATAAGPAFERLSPPGPAASPLSLSPLPGAVVPAPFVSAAAPLTASIVVAVPALAAPETSKAALSGRVALMAESSAQAIEKVASAASSRADLRRSGEDLEAVLSGELLRRPAAEDDGPRAPASSRTGSALRPAPAPSGRAASEFGVAAPSPDIPERARSGFRLYAGGVSAVKVGIEALNLVVPALLLSQYGAAALIGALFLSAQLAGLVAGWVAGPLVDRFSPAKVLAVTAVLQISAIGAIPLAFALGASFGLPVIFALFTVNGLLGGAFDIARRAALPQILGRDERVLNAHNAKIYISRELAAMAGIFATGLLLDKLGYLATLAIHPAAYIIAALLFARLAFRRGGAAPAFAKGEFAPAEKSAGALAAINLKTAVGLNFHIPSRASKMAASGLVM